MSDSNSIRVLSLNCWGLKYVAKDRDQRITAIADFLSVTLYDIVCLQELWVQKDFERIRTAVSGRLSYFKLFLSGAMGTGLAIFTRFPIIATSLQPFCLNGHPLDFKGADWFAGKGVAVVLITHPILGQIDLFNTHFFSEGGDDGPEFRRAHRLVNAWEFAKLIRHAAAVGRYIIAVGDFNSAPHTLPMTVIREHAGLEDVWNDIDPQLPSLPLQSAPSSTGFTYDSPLNSYASRSHDHTSVPQGKRLDYIFFRNPTQFMLPVQLTPSDARVVLMESVPGRSFSYSDHFGVEATFTMAQTGSKDNVLIPASGHLSIGMASLDPTSICTPHLSPAHTLMVIDALRVHLTRATICARIEMCVAATCIVLLVALCVGTGWNPQGFLTPVFVILGAITTYIGTTLFHVGFLYRRWEANALLNHIGEMEVYLEGLGSG